MSPLRNALQSLAIKSWNGEAGAQRVDVNTALVEFGIYVRQDNDRK